MKLRLNVEAEVEDFAALKDFLRPLLPATLPAMGLEAFETATVTDEGQLAVKAGPVRLLLKPTLESG